jgi:hypothetical protein
VASECSHLQRNTDAVDHKVQRRNLCGAMRPEQKKSCETREFDSASAECEKEQSENIFTQAVGLRLVLLNAVLRVFFF